MCQGVPKRVWWGDGVRAIFWGRTPAKPSPLSLTVEKGTLDTNTIPEHHKQHVPRFSEPSISSPGVLAVAAELQHLTSILTRGCAYGRAGGGDFHSTC